MDSERSTVNQAILGAWRLVSFQVKKEDGTCVPPFGDDAHGSILYLESGHFSAQLMRCGRPCFASADQMTGSPAEMKACFQGYVAYYGTFPLDQDGGFVVHQVVGSLFPNWEGLALKRFVAFSGDRLTLTTPPTTWGGEGQIVGSLVWERMDAPAS